MLTYAYAKVELISINDWDLTKMIFITVSSTSVKVKLDICER